MTDTTYENLNAEIYLLGPDGKIQFEKDAESARAYHIEYVNKHTRFFHSLREKTDYLLDNNLWKRETVELFTFDQFKDLFKLAYSYKFRFPSFQGAKKTYAQYALLDLDGETIVERYEDRVVMCAIDVSGGDYQQARDIVDAIITGRFQPATPTFLNAGRAQGGERVSCFLLRTEDNTPSIMNTVRSSSELSRRAGGVGILGTNIREFGAPIQNNPGKAKGLVPFMKLLEDTFKYFDQLGQRQGAGAIYVNAHHPDILRVLDTKRENADEAFRIKTLSIGVIIPDITVQLAKANKDMYLFSPYDVKKVMGKPLSELSVTEHYHDWVEDERIRKTKINARSLWQTLSELQFESGYPYILFEDTANRAHPLKNAGRVQMSNLCYSGDTEILTDGGYRKAIDLYELQEDFKVVADSRSFDMNLKSKDGAKVVESSRMFKTAEDVDVYKVSTNEGFEIKVTEWHKFYVDRDGELVKIPLNEVIEGDRILVQGGETPDAARGNFHNPDLAYIAGVMAADGTYANKDSAARIDLYGDKEQFSDKVLSAVHRLLDGRDDLCERQATTAPEWNVRLLPSPKLHMNSTPLGKILKEHGIGPENKVSVPDFVKRGDRATQKAFIDGVWAMDGCITGSAKYRVRSMELGSIHKQFLIDMQKLLLTFGVYTRIFDGKGTGALAMLPDGRGGLSEYFQSQSWSLRANSKMDCSALFELVEWRESSVAKWNEVMANVSPRSWTNHKFRATVKSIEYAGTEDVYDVTVPTGHSQIANGISTGNCSEILQFQTASEFNKDGSYKTEGADISCNLGSLNIGRMLELNNEEFLDTVVVAVRALDQVSRSTSLNAVPSVRKGNEDTHSIGLGLMNLHGALGERRMFYDSPEARALFSRLCARMTHSAMLASKDLAKVHGPHKYHKGSEYDTGEWFRRVVDPKIEEYGDDLTIWGELTAPTAEEWRDLEREVRIYGMANGYLQAVPPTGSISYINHSTSSIHPVMAPIEIRKEGTTGRTYYPAPGMTNDNLEYFQPAADIGAEATILMYAEGQHWIDQGMSLTLAFPDKVTDAKTGEIRDVTTRDLDKARIFAWKHGIKTLYYIRIRQAAMSGTQVEGTASAYIQQEQDNSDECKSCAL